MIEQDYWGFDTVGYVTFNPYKIAAGESVIVDTEHDWNRPNMEPSFSVTVWGEVS